MRQKEKRRADRRSFCNARIVGPQAFVNRFAGVTGLWRIDDDLLHPRVDVGEMLMIVRPIFRA